MIKLKLDINVRDQNYTLVYFEMEEVSMQKRILTITLVTTKKCAHKSDDL